MDSREKEGPAASFILLVTRYNFRAGHGESGRSALILPRESAMLERQKIRLANTSARRRAGALQRRREAKNGKEPLANGRKKNSQTEINRLALGVSAAGSWGGLRPGRSDPNGGAHGERAAAPCRARSRPEPAWAAGEGVGPADAGGGGCSRDGRTNSEGDQV